jgi:hypothetical protein
MCKTTGMKEFINVLNPDVQNYIKAHEKHDVSGLILKGSPFENIDIQYIAQQIIGRQVAKHKFVKLYKTDGILYPPKLNLEQASSQITATYKSSLIEKNSTLIDLTGGFGIDAIAFVSVANEVSYCEINHETFLYTTHNFNTLDLDIKTFQTDGLKYLSNSKDKFDWIYLDPARRDNYSNKVFRLEDCTPNILDHLDLFKSKCRRMMVKISPLFDINLSVKQLPEIYEIHIVAFKNEVKELLLLLDFENKCPERKIISTNLGTDDDIFKNDYKDLNLSQNLSLPLNYLFEPNAAIMKSGFFGSLCNNYNVNALAKNSHLFTSKDFIRFPGRSFKIKHVISPKTKEINKYIPTKKANISTRNYPLKPNQIKKKYKLKDGGSTFVFFTENLKNEKIAIICEKIKQP